VVDGGGGGGGGGSGGGGSKGATLVEKNCPFLLWYNICTRWIETRSCLPRSSPRSTSRSLSGGNELTNLPKAEIKVGGGERELPMTSNCRSRIRKCSKFLLSSLAITRRLARTTSRWSSGAVVGAAAAVIAAAVVAAA